MTRQPYTDPDTLHVLQDAIEVLALVRGRICPLLDPHEHPDPGEALHLLQSLILQADAYLPDLITAAYDHGYASDDIRRFLGLPPR